MPSTPDISSLRRMHERSIDVLTQSLERLKQLAALALSPPVQDRVRAEISTAQVALDTTKIVAVRLRAAEVVVNPPSDETAARLSTLATSIDEAIERDAVLTASFADVREFIQQAQEVHQIIGGAISPAAATA